jgi:hypothetical protein
MVSNQSLTNEAANTQGVNRRIVASKVVVAVSFAQSPLLPSRLQRTQLVKVSAPRLAGVSAVYAQHAKDVPTQNN